MLQNEVTRTAAVSFFKREMAHAAMGVRTDRFENTGMVFGRRGRVAPDAEILFVAGVAPVRVGNGKHAMPAEFEHTGMVLGRLNLVALIAVALTVTPGTHKRLNS
jgi:hypothetical protein